MTATQIQWCYLPALPIKNRVVLAGWTNDDEFYVVPSAYDGHRWFDQDGEFVTRKQYRVYTWADWPEAPEVKRC